MSTKPVIFKSSKLSSAADQLWTASKNEFKADERSVKLDLGKTLNNERSGTKGLLGTKASNNTGFIFGSKLTERVIVSDESSQKHGNVEVEGNKICKNGSLKSVAAVFEDIKQKGAASTFVAISKNSNGEGDSACTSKLLNDAVEETRSEQETSQAPKPEVEVTTGEENEENMYHGMCKLHSFDITSSTWVERGMSTLRINRIKEKVPFEYRIVGRVTGNQRVVLNSKISPDIVIERVSTKRVKFSATPPDSEHPFLFLTTASEFVTEQLYSTLVRIVNSTKDELLRKRRAVSESDEEEAVVSKKAVC